MFEASAVSEKSCSRCKAILPASEFYPHKRVKSGLQSHCRSCSREWHRERPDYIRRKNAEFKRKNPTYHADRNRLVKYGLTRSQIDDLISSQKGGCLGCNRELVSLKTCVDHDHSSGRVRGIICDDCNIVLGRVRDDPRTLSRLAEYVLAHRLEAEAYN